MDLNLLKIKHVAMNIVKQFIIALHLPTLTVL